MLSNESLQAGQQLGTALAAVGIVLEPAHNTPISSVASTMNVAALESESVIERIKESVAPLNVGFDPHTAEVKRTTTIMAERVAGNIRLARTMLIPTIKDIAVACTKRRIEIEQDSPLNVSIRQVATLGALTLPELEAQYSRFRTGSHRFFTVTGKLSSMLLGGLNDVILEEAITRPSDAYAKAIKELITEASTHYGWSQASDLLLKDVTVSNNSTELFRNPLLVLNFLFLTAALNGKLTNFPLDDLSLQERTELAKLQAYYGQKLSFQVDSIISFAKSGRFIIPANSTKKEASVYARNYSKWVKEGGEAESVKGAMMLSENSSMVSVSNEILSNQDKFKSHYLRSESTMKARQRMVTTREMQGAVESELFAFIHQEMAEENRGVLARRAKAYFGSNVLQNNGDLLTYIRDAVCKVTAPDTNCLQILNDIEAFTEEDENMSVHRASVLAGARLMAKWCAKQVVARRAKAPGISVQEL